MTPEDLASLKPGDRLRWVPPPAKRHARKSYGAVVTLSHRKEDGTGWWNTDGSGLDDRLALLSDSWVLDTQ